MDATDDVAKQNKGDDDNSGINTLTPVIIVFADVWVRNTCFLTRLLRFVF